jgi:hypothetical protein
MDELLALATQAAEAAGPPQLAASRPYTTQKHSPPLHRAAKAFQPVNHVFTQRQDPKESQQGPAVFKDLGQGSSIYKMSGLKVNMSHLSAIPKTAWKSNAQ